LERAGAIRGRFRRGPTGEEAQKSCIGSLREKDES